VTRTDFAESRPQGGGRQRIMDTAAELFLRQGYSETSLRHIAGAVGMKAGSLYYHFDSKDELLTAILRRGIAVMVDAFSDGTDTTADMSARDVLATHIRAHLGALFEHGPYTAAHVITFPTAPRSVRDEIVPDRDRYEALWTDLLQDLVATGEMAGDVDIGLSRLTLFGAMNTTIEWFDPERGSLDELAETITRQFWDGVAANGAMRGRRAS
jgi:AcrR family transcriptional regulator